MIAQAVGGLMSITGEEDGPPCKPGATIGDTGTGMVMAISVLGAYVRKLRTGQGEHLQLAMQDSILHYVRNAFTFMERSGGKAGAARRIEDGRRRQSADRRVSVQGRRPERLCLHLHQPRQSRALDPAAESDGTRGPDRRCEATAIPMRVRERREEVDAIVSDWTMQARQARGDAPGQPRHHPVGRGARHGGTGGRQDFREARHSPDDEASEGRRLRHERLAGSLWRQDAGGGAGAVCLASMARKCWPSG